MCKGLLAFFLPARCIHQVGLAKSPGDLFWQLFSALTLRLSFPPVHPHTEALIGSLR